MNGCIEETRKEGQKARTDQLSLKVLTCKHYRLNSISLLLSNRLQNHESKVNFPNWYTLNYIPAFLTESLGHESDEKRILLKDGVCSYTKGQAQAFT